MIFSIDLVLCETQHLHFKVFLSIYMHQFRWLSERGGNVLNLLQKEGGTQRGMGSSEKGGFQPRRKLDFRNLEAPSGEDIDFRKTKLRL